MAAILSRGARGGWVDFLNSGDTYVSLSWILIVPGNGLLLTSDTTQTNAELLSIRPSVTNFTVNHIRIQDFSFNNMHLKMFVIYR